MAAVWPPTLPDTLEVQGYREQPPDTSIRTAMDAGPPKVRRRYTAGVRQLVGRIHCTNAQVATLDNFYLSVLASGSLPFDWTHPRTGAAGSYRFRSAPSYEPHHKDLWQVTVELELLP